MFRRKPAYYSRIMTILTGIAAAFLVIFIVLFPEQAFQSSLKGLKIWWDIVFPALLPFLIASEIMIGFGLVHALGVLLEPLMQLCFRIPGVGGWALAAGFTAGFPAGAEITANLRKQRLISRSEGERLLAVSHLCGPVFIVSAVAAGFLQRPELGAVMAFIHGLCAFIVGIAMRFFHAFSPLSEPDHPARKSVQSQPIHRRRPVWSRCFSAMHEARLRDGRTFGKLLGDAVYSSVQTLLIVGGYMMIFSVIISVLTLSNIVSAATGFLGLLLLPFGIPDAIVSHTLTGIFEANIGAYAVSQEHSVPLVWRAAMIGAVLGWSGFSLHAQVKSLIHSTDLRYGPFLFSRILHAVLAFFLTFALWKPLNAVFRTAAPSFLRLDMNDTSARHAGAEWSSWAHMPGLLLGLASSLAFLLGISIIAAVIGKFVKTD